jgi:hypothetical protein
MSAWKSIRRVFLRRWGVVLAAAGAATLGPAAHVWFDASVDASPGSALRGTTPRQQTVYSTGAVAPAAPETLRVTPKRPASSWTAVAHVLGRPAAWVARRTGVVLMRFNQQLLHLNLHAGSSDGGMAGWPYGDSITPGEAPLLVAAINGGFRLSHTNVGFISGGRVAVPLSPGLASLVTYSDGTSDIGAWEAGVPSRGKTVFSVLQNQQLLVDHGVATATVSDCVLKCWGGTVGGLTVVARSGLGITANGQLVWAAGERLSPSRLAADLIAAGAVRAIELDINPFWVAGYLYTHQSGGPSPVPLVPGQRGVAGTFLRPYSRDFLAVVAN